jgi:thiol-disulfide isomerase/thioredoxin
MNIAKTLAISFLLADFFPMPAQQISAVYKIGELEKRIANIDTLYIVNFWATWCKPCIKELSSFDSLERSFKKEKIKILLVSLDFKEQKEKVNNFLVKNKTLCECALLDEVNGDIFINRISEKWSGTIPATLIKKGNKKIFLEKSVTRTVLESKVKDLYKN